MGVQKRHVLLVDDNPNDLELALEVLGQGHTDAQVVTAQGGPEAMAYLETHRDQCERPSLVLLDLNMPQLDGLGVLDAIRADAALHDIPVVMLTTSREQSDIQACYKRGANGYLVKPPDLAVFAETLKATLAFWLGQNQLAQQQAR
ncbi:response regulator [Deinococcus radiomollis]|uniref:response regulator n=1 Tax=Deinococcus radiomollis TaxID=468916 RepID=UPI003892A0E5